ncbi:MAG: BamA/TamA family outer membrane protein [Rhodobacteraceae bacterium]|nr:BamA/TamA family outer membrane protein [Paracoccaceae bacterium]
MNVVGMSNEDRRDDLIKLLEAASLSYGALDEGTENAQDLYGRARSDYARMIAVLYSEGYYGPGVSIKIDGREVADISPLRLPRAVDRIDISVQPGPRFHFDQIDVAPRAPNPPNGPIVDGFATGETARSDLIGAAANAGVREWREDGHAKATVRDQKIVARHPDRALDVDINLAPGPQLRFGSLTITGDRDVSDRRVRQIMGFPQGEIYSPQEIRDAVNRIRRTGVFKTVALTEAETPNPDGTLDYSLTLIEEKPRRFGFSAEYSTLDGLTVGGFWLHRNLFGGAERLRIDAEAANIGGDQTGLGDSSGEDYSASLRLTRPGTFGPDNDAFFFSEFESTDDPDYEETAFTFGVGVTRYFNPQLFGEVAGGLRYSHVNDAFGDREFYHAVLPSRLEWDKRDDPGDAKGGFYLDTTATPYIGLKDSQSGMVAELDARGYVGFGQDKPYVFAGRLQLGSVVGSDLDETPPDFLFFSGGGDTVRGQRYQSLGVDVGNGEQSGGRSFVGLSGEFRASVSKSLGLVAFMDWGFVGPDSYYSDAGRSQSGVGLGVRYATPIGPIRVDFATPYSGGGDRFKSVELYIGVGQAF